MAYALLNGIKNLDYHQLKPDQFVQIAVDINIHMRMLLHMHRSAQTSDMNVPLPMPPSFGSGPAPAVSSERKQIRFLSAGSSTVRRTWHASME
jgi:hypothetical protein